MWSDTKNTMSGAFTVVAHPVRALALFTDA
jgi:hypothetical protein